MRHPDPAQLSLFIHELEQSPPENIKIGTEVEAPASRNTRLNCTMPADEGLPSEGADELSNVPECDWSRFMRIHGRVPLLGDKKQPWQYRGWLLYYRLLSENHPSIAPRWHYWVRTREAGKLLDEPIPVLRFEDCGSQENRKLVEGWLQAIDRHHSHWSPMDILLEWFLWGFGLAEEPPKISERLNETLYRQVSMGPMLLKPYDYLGEWIANQKGKWNPHAFFPTPHTVVEFMVRMAFEENAGEDLRSKTVMEPCLGSGRMLLHASNYSVRLWGVDIDPMMVKTSLVNGALYAPWMIRPFPESYFSYPAPMEAKANIATEDALHFEEVVTTD